MADEKKRTGDGARPLNADEANLWSNITTGVKPLKHRPAASKRAPSSPPALKKTPAREQPARPVHPLKAPALVKPKSRPSVPSPHTIDAGLRRRLRRGQIAPEARLDLHGHTQAMAHRALAHFINGAQAAGRRVVLVITGKGGSSYTRHTLHGGDFFHAAERKGVLRQAALSWLAEPPLSHKVVGLHPAHPRHGGGGAIYVVLRRLPGRSN